MTLDHLPTPCLILDRSLLARNLERMHAVIRKHGVGWRPHFKTSKCLEVLRLALDGFPPAATVSTLGEAAFLLNHGVEDLLYAVGITPEKLAMAARLNQKGARLKVITDEPEMAALIRRNGTVEALVEVDAGEGRGGVPLTGDRLEKVATALGPACRGLLVQAGHSYRQASIAAIGEVAARQRAVALEAAERLRAIGADASILSAGSTPAILHASALSGITEVRAGVFMFGDLFQAAIGTHAPGEIALSVLASVIGRREESILVDAGALALSKDRSTAATAHDAGYGIVCDLNGIPYPGPVRVESVSQEHGTLRGPLPPLRLGDKVRILPNHACLSAAAHDRYHVVEGSLQVSDVWHRQHGWYSEDFLCKPSNL